MPEDRRPVSFAEACERPCAYRVSECSGPTASGLHGYACERCLLKVLKELDEGQTSVGATCSYCGAAPAFDEGLPEAVCAICVAKALGAVRCWYERKECGHG